MKDIADFRKAVRMIPDLVYFPHSHADASRESRRWRHPDLLEGMSSVPNPSPY